jgi:hypothetical protein
VPLSDGPQPTELTIFLSSGDDLSLVRDRIENLVHRVFNPELREHRARFRFAVERWERAHAQRNEPGESTNDRFVRKARESHVTVALLLEQLGVGTREELEAVLNETTHDLAPLWFVPRGSEPATEVASFLDEHKDDLLYEQVGIPDSTESWEGVVKFLLSRTLAAMSADEGVYREQR